MAWVIQAVHRLAGRMFQLINGISKLRVDGAEGSAFAVWAGDYREQKQAELELGRLEEHLQAFSAALPFLTAAMLFLAVALQDPGAVTVGGFLVIFIAFTVFQAAVARLGESFGAVAAIMPALDQIRPFLAEPPETSVEGEPVGNLGGEVLFDHVTFRYDPDGPLILDDVSIRARPGEFVAIAGESGRRQEHAFPACAGSGAAQFGIGVLRRARPPTPQSQATAPEDRRGSAGGAASPGGHLGQYRRRQR